MSDEYIIKHLQDSLTNAVTREVKLREQLEIAATAFSGIAVCGTCGLCRELAERQEAAIRSFLDSLRTPVKEQK